MLHTVVRESSDPFYGYAGERLRCMRSARSAAFASASQCGLDVAIVIGYGEIPRSVLSVIKIPDLRISRRGRGLPFDSKSE
jgi:hypothetical protein